MTPWIFVDIHYTISWVEITVMNSDTDELRKIRLSVDDIATLGGGGAYATKA